MNRSAERERKNSASAIPSFVDEDPLPNKEESDPALCGVLDSFGFVF
jgi:hypothetical protein